MQLVSPYAPRHHLPVWPLLTIESPVAQWLKHPTRSRRVVGSNTNWNSDFFRVDVSTLKNFYFENFLIILNTLCGEKKIPRPMCPIKLIFRKHLNVKQSRKCSLLCVFAFSFLPKCAIPGGHLASPPWGTCHSNATPPPHPLHDPIKSTSHCLQK